jgi:hypothetical protein
MPRTRVLTFKSVFHVPSTQEQKKTCCRAEYSRPVVNKPCGDYRAILLYRRGKGRSCSTRQREPEPSPQRRETMEGIEGVKSEGEKLRILDRIMDVDDCPSCYEVGHFLSSAVVVPG